VSFHWVKLDIFKLKILKFKFFSAMFQFEQYMNICQARLWFKTDFFVIGANALG